MTIRIFHIYNLSQAAPNSAALGGAYRARYCYLRHGDTELDPDMTFSRMMEPVMETAKLVASPNKDAVMVYGPIIERYKKLENIVVNNFNASNSKES